LPITLEDAHPTSGMRSTWGGLPRLADHVPEKDGTLAARLRAAGAILLGKTSGPEIWPDSVFARTNNPWDLAHTPGGSSAGVGATIAAGLTSLDIGLDTSQGLPFGLQIIGKRWADERLLGIAESVSELTGGFRQPPGY
jgi:amidase